MPLISKLLFMLLFLPLLVGCKKTSDAVSSPTIAYIGEYDCKAITETTYLSPSRKETTNSIFTAHITRETDSRFEFRNSVDGSWRLSMDISGTSFVIPKYSFAQTTPFPSTAVYFDDVLGNGKLDGKTLIMELVTTREVSTSLTPRYPVSSATITYTCFKK